MSVLAGCRLSFFFFFPNYARESGVQPGTTRTRVELGFWVGSLGESGLTHDRLPSNGTDARKLPLQGGSIITSVLLRHILSDFALAVGLELVFANKGFCEVFLPLIYVTMADQIFT